MRFDFGSGDTEADTAQEQVQAFASGIASEQGGTELASANETIATPGVDFPLERERVNCDPQGFGYEVERSMLGNDDCCEDDYEEED